MQTTNRFKSRPHITSNSGEPLKKQRADSLSGAWRRQRGNPLYLAVLIGGMSLIFFAIVVSPLG
jgi:high-affinity K+ transport system ATPase subunit B